MDKRQPPGFFHSTIEKALIYNTGGKLVWHYQDNSY